MVAKIKLIIAHIIVWGAILGMLFMVVKLIYDEPLLRGIATLVVILVGGVLILRWALDEVSK